MNITLKLGTYNFLKNQQSTADTLLKPLFDDNTDHLLIKVLTGSGQYRLAVGTINKDDPLYLMTYLKFNNDQAAIFDNKIYSDDHNFIIDKKDSAIFQKRDDHLDYLIITTFADEKAMRNWKELISKQIYSEMQKFSEEPFGFFTHTYRIA